MYRVLWLFPLYHRRFFIGVFRGQLRSETSTVPEKLLFFLGVGWKASDMLLIDNPYARIKQNDGKKRRKTTCNPQKMWSSSAGAS